MEISASKRRLRREVRARILAMEPGDRLRQQDALERLFPGLPGFAEARTVLLYASAFPEEVETRGMLRQALGLGKRLILPRVDPAGDRLRLHEIRDLENDLIAGSKGIPEPGPGAAEVEPADVDWVLVPGLAFDAEGHRLGRGRGHYDRLLGALRPEVPRWALAFEVQRLDAVPVDPHDRDLDGVATAEGLTATARADCADFPVPTR